MRSKIDDVFKLKIPLRNTTHLVSFYRKLLFLILFYLHTLRVLNIQIDLILDKIIIIICYDLIFSYVIHIFNICKAISEEIFALSFDQKTSNF